MASGDRIGSWILLDQLGEGGNGVVWKAQRDNGDIDAVKLLKTLNPDSESYKRFRDEIRVLQRLPNEPGILPLIAHDLPDWPTSTRRAWLAMPLAIPIRDALSSGPSLEAVVAAIAEIASTLVRLAECGISHRDIKPGNLYQYVGRFVIGDFGLVNFPEKDAITTNERALGPRNFLAPEMISNPDSADGKPADVYSLAKTFWVLATDQKWPPPGHQIVESSGTSIASLVSHPRVRQLDWVVERATTHVPSDRITMHKMENELRAWLKPDERSTEMPDLAALGDRFKGLVVDRDRAEAKRRRWREESQRVLTAWAEQLSSHADALANYGFSVTFRPQDSNPTIAQSGLLLADHGRLKLAWQDGRCILISAPGDDNFLLWIGVGLSLGDDGMATLTAGTRLRLAGDRHEVLWADERQCSIESAEVRLHTANLLDLLVAAVPTALQRFTDDVEASRASENRLSVLDLTATISAMAVWLNESSEHAVDGFDFADPLTAQSDLSLNEEQLLDAIGEIEARGWVVVNRVASGAQIAGIATLKPTPSLFIDTDPILRGWEPARDARRVASIALDKGEGPVGLRELADSLGWGARRMNPAVYFLVQVGAVDNAVTSTGSFPFAYDWVVVGANTRRFLMH